MSEETKKSNEEDIKRKSWGGKNKIPVSWVRKLSLCCSTGPFSKESQIHYFQFPSSPPQLIGLRTHLSSEGKGRNFVGHLAKKWNSRSVHLFQTCVQSFFRIQEMCKGNHIMSRLLLLHRNLHKCLWLDKNSEKEIYFSSSFSFLSFFFSRAKHFK